jgi:hypothetical protein
VGYLPELRKSQMERRTFNAIVGFFSSLLARAAARFEAFAATAGTAYR